ncbi:MAG: M28 family peptidase [Desulfomonilaceae bacterium]
MFGEGFLVDIWNGSYTEPIILSAQEKVVKARLERHVNRLASEIGIRNTAKPDALEAAARYIENTFREVGLEVRSQQFHCADGTKARNIEAVIYGHDPIVPCLIVGAHYDSVNCPGANDNASAVAALLEVARVISEIGKPRHTIRFVAFANEEPPYFGSDDMGSWVYARDCVHEKKDALGMICLEDIGYYCTEPGSQTMPHPINAIYGNDVGNFVAICGNSESRDLVASVLRSFRSHCDFPAEGLAAPEKLIPDITLSDNMSFWRAGIKAVMITDTVYLRYPHYHQVTDTADKLSYPAFARVTRGLCDTVWTLINSD